jgi:hypothetical protein
VLSQKDLSIAVETEQRDTDNSRGKVLWEVIDLFMGDCIPPLNNKDSYLDHKLELRSIAALEKQLTTRLDRLRLDKESRKYCDDDSASHLSHEVHHVYNCINIAKSCDQEVDGNSPQDKITVVLDKVMDYKSSDVIPNMDGHAFDKESEDNKADNDEGDIQINRADASMRPCLLDLTRTGWNALENLKVREVRQYHTNCMQQKRDTMKYILMQVVEMKTTMWAISICEENPMAEISTWSVYLNELQPNYYL